MNATETPTARRRAWLRWILFSEGLILLLAVAGPGSRRVFRRGEDQSLIARWFTDDPSFLEAVFVNFVALHVFIGLVWFAAWLVTRSRQKRS